MLSGIRIACTFSVGVSEERTFSNTDDPFYKTERRLDDIQWTLGHFKIKLLKLEGFIHAKTAKKIARAY